MKQQRNFLRLGDPGGGDNGCFIAWIILGLLVVGMIVIGVIHKYT